MAQINSAKRKRDADKEPHSKRRKGDGVEGTTEREMDPAAYEASVKAYMFHAVKLLLKALKKSRTFEVQKVVRKLKTTREPKEGAPDAVAIADLEAQLAALKALALDAFPPHLLTTRLPKLSFLHPILPSLRASIPSSSALPAGLDPKSPAAKARNRTLANKLVKEAWDEVSRAVSKRMGQEVEDRPVPIVVPVAQKVAVEVLPAPMLDAEGNEVKPKRLSKRAERAAKGAAKALLPKAGMNAARKAAIAAAEEEDSDEGDGEEDYADVGSGSELDDDDEVTRELALLGAGSGSDDFSEDNQSDADDDDEADKGYLSGSSVEAPPPKPSKSKPAKAAPAPKSRKPTKAPTSSAFLPSLAGGYISYSDSDGEDAKWVKEAEKGDKKERKNRRGQRARQAIWEAKYGSGANHIAKTTGAVPAIAKGGKANSGAFKPRAKPVSVVDAAPEPFDPSKQRGAENNANAQPVAPRKASTVEKGMHPSWEAKRKAADAQAALVAAPKGKKITFD